MASRIQLFLTLLIWASNFPAFAATTVNPRQTTALPVRERLSLNLGWKFQRSTSNPDSLSYGKLKAWILPSANDFISDTSKRARRPADQPANVTFAQPSFDDSAWESLNLPHDWAVKGPFYTGANAVIGGGMGRLPIQGIAWYRRKFTVGESDKGKSIFLEIDGAMSYAMVWLNGFLVGGWPYGYASFNLDLTPYIQPGENQLAIRLTMRWIPAAFILERAFIETCGSPRCLQSMLRTMGLG